MKTILRTTLFLFLYISNTQAQTSIQNLDLLKKTISDINPNADFYNKIIFVSIWKSTDFESRAANKEAYRVYKIYERAKLKNGEKGTVFISVNLDEDEHTKNFAVRKDTIDEAVVYSDKKLVDAIQINLDASNIKNNFVVDKYGVIQYTNLKKDQIFSTLRGLITR